MSTYQIWQVSNIDAIKTEHLLKKIVVKKCYPLSDNPYQYFDNMSSELLFKHCGPKKTNFLKILKKWHDRLRVILRYIFVLKLRQPFYYEVVKNDYRIRVYILQCRIHTWWLQNDKFYSSVFHVEIIHR